MSEKVYLGYFLNLLLYFASVFTYFIIMYGKERCKQIEDNVGSNLPCQPDLETLIRISDLLKVDVNDLLNKECIKE